MRLLPTTAEEREIAVAPILRGAQKRGWLAAAERKGAIDALAKDWRLARTIVRIVGFVVGAVLVASLFGFLSLLEMPGKGIATAIVSIAVAEVLIARGRFWKSGIEEVLWIGGLFAIIFDLPGPARNEGLLLFAFASLLAAIRLLQPWFATAFVGFVVMYLVTEFERDLVAATLVYLIGAAALLLLSHKWKMPFVENALSMIVLCSLPLAYLLLRFVAEVGSDLSLLAGAVSMIVFFASGLALRNRAPLWGALLTSGLVLFEAATRIVIAAEWKWLIAGVALVAIAQLVDRILRNRESGITSRREPVSEIYALAETAAAHAASVASRPEQPEPLPPDRESGGGSFGGAGASGDY